MCCAVCDGRIQDMCDTLNKKKTCRLLFPSFTGFNLKEEAAYSFKSPVLELEIILDKGKGKGKTTPVQTYCIPRSFQEAVASRFRDSLHMKVVRLPALHVGRFTPHPGNIPGTHFSGP
jgi:hypothetical protein